MAGSIQRLESRFVLDVAPGTYSSGQTLLAAVQLQDSSYGCYQSEPARIAVPVP